MNKKTEIIEAEQSFHPIAVQESQYLPLIQMCIEKGTELVQIEKLMDLQERHEANEARKQFNFAMSIFQSSLPVIEKNGLVNYTSSKGTTNYDYAKLEDISHAIKPSLKASGLSYRWTQEQSEGKIKVTCIVTHVNGHVESSSLIGFPDTSGGKDPMKAMASAISYLRRYTLTGLLGIVVGGEDDEGGEGGFGEAPNEKVNEFYADEAFNKIFPKWKELIEGGKKTPDEIIGNGNKRGLVFSPEQLDKINKVSKK